MANNSKSLRIRLIESAADLFIKNGYYNTTLKMIADGAHQYWIARMGIQNKRRNSL